MKIHVLVSAVLVVISGTAFTQVLSQTTPRAPTQEVVTTKPGGAPAGKEAVKADPRSRAATQELKTNRLTSTQERARESQDTKRDQWSNQKEAIRKTLDNAKETQPDMRR